MARPTLIQARIIKKRNNEIKLMIREGYPLDYIVIYTGLTKGRISQIIKEKPKQNNK
jgi:hypothetical protein